MPIFIVSGWCDLMPCDVAQATGLASSMELAPGSTMSTRVSDLDAQVGAAVQWLKIKGTGEPVTSCMPASVCGAAIATLIHTEWPDGVASTAGGAVDQEPAMLDFLRLHPLP